MRQAALLVGLLLVAPAAAQQHPVAVEDPVGDVRYDTAAGSADGPQVHEGVDIVKAWIGNETLETFDAGLETHAERSTASGPEPRTETVDTVVAFSFGGIEYRLEFDRCGEDGAGLQPDIGCVPAQRTGSAWVATIPKDKIVDADNIPLRTGSTIDSWYAYGEDSIGPGNEVWDRAPDADFGEPFTLRLGNQSFGDLSLFTPAPIRSSNGGPDTMVFPLTVTNAGAAKDLVITVGDVPEGWEVRSPSTVTVPSDGNVRIPVIVTTASAHAHGTTQAFKVQVDPLQGPTGEVELGIEYLAVPQLAGHHPRAYLHAAEDTPDVPCAGSTHAWFNTVAEDPEDTGQPIASTGGGQNMTHANVKWRNLPMDPELLVGLDFDLERTGTFKAEIEPRAPGDEARLHVQLDHCGDGGRETLAAGVSAPKELQRGEAVLFEVELRPNDIADVVPFDDGSNIVLDLELSWQGATTVLGSAAAADLLPHDAYMELPLTEYKDPIDAAFEEIGSLGLIAEGAFQRDANPGQAVWYGFVVENRGDAARTVRLDAAGQALEWTAWKPTAPFRVAAGETVDVAFRIDVPADAVTGQVFETFAIAEDVDDPSVVALSKLRTVVTDEPVQQPPAPDVAVPAAKNSPGAPVVMLLVAMALLIRRLR